MNICLYGASSQRISDAYIKKNEALGKEIAQRKHTLVYGGGATGLMGAAARGATAGNGKIIGITPKFFQKVDGEIYENCTELILTENMRDRKSLLESHADAFVVTPGGPGTYDEFFEILAARQLGLHKKAIAFYNINNYFEPLFKMLENTVEQNVMRRECLTLFKAFDEPKQLIDYLETYKPEDNDSFTVLRKISN